MVLNCFVVVSIFAIKKKAARQKQNLYNIPLPVLLSPASYRVDMLLSSDYQCHLAYI